MIPETMHVSVGIRGFVAAFSICSLMSQVLSVYLSSQITAIERQFGLNSAQSGFLLSCNDIGFLAATLLSSYMATRVHIPRGLALSLIIYGVGGLICSLAYFASNDMFDGDISSTDKQFLQSTTGRQNQNVESLKPSNVSATKSLTMRRAFTCNVHSKSYSSDDAKVHRNSSVMPQGTTFNVGNPNEYTMTAITFLAIGKCFFVFISCTLCN